MEDIGASVLEDLGRDEALGLLDRVPIGRVAMTEKALPAIRVVNFALDQGDVVIASRPGSKLDALLGGAVVAFEADAYDAELCTGWTVVVVGRARVVNDADDERRLTARLRAWVPLDDGSRFVRIDTAMISGRRVVRAFKSGPVMRSG